MFGKLAIVFLTAMVPVFELRAAIPTGAAMKLDPVPVFFAAVIGNLLPVPVIILFVRKVFEWMRKKSARLEKVVEKLEVKAEKNKKRVLQYEFWGLALLVAVPLPGTGAWTGSLVAAMLDMQLKRAIPAIAMGVLIAGVVVTLISYGIASI